MKSDKARGLQRLRWYCQACEKQCRDEHGFRLHCSAASHRAKAETAAKNVPEYSRRFEATFVAALRGLPRQPVEANRVYGEIIRDPAHVHMSATRWRSLAAFVRHLHARGTVQILTTDPLVVSYIDQAAVQRRAAEHAAQQHKREDQERTHRAILERQLQSEAEPEPRGQIEADPKTDSEAKKTGAEATGAEASNTEPEARHQIASRKPIKFSLKR